MVPSAFSTVMLTQKRPSERLVRRPAIVPPSEEIDVLLGDLDHAGNNGWYRQGYKTDEVLLILSRLDKHVSRDFTAGSMLAHGHSVKAVRALLGPV